MVFIALILAFFISAGESDIRVGTDNCHIGVTTSPTVAIYSLCYIPE